METYNKLKKIYYKGFSTRSYAEKGNGFELHNVACIQDDLLNQIFTVKGDRLHDMTFGTRIPLLVFEMCDDDTFEVIREDLVQVIKDDPRVDLLNLDILPQTERGILITILRVNYKEFNVTQDLRIVITSR